MIKLYNERFYVYYKVAIHASENDLINKKLDTIERLFLRRHGRIANDLVSYSYSVGVGINEHLFL